MREVKTAVDLLESSGLDVSHLSLGSSILIIFIIWMIRESAMKKKLNGHGNGNGHGKNKYIEKSLSKIEEDIRNLYNLQRDHAKDLNGFKSEIFKFIAEFKGKFYKEK